MFYSTTELKRLYRRLRTKIRCPDIEAHRISLICQSITRCSRDVCDSLEIFQLDACRINTQLGDGEARENQRSVGLVDICQSLRSHPLWYYHLTGWLQVPWVAESSLLNMELTCVLQIDRNSSPF